MIKKLLIANRGEIACRIIRTLDRLGIASVAVYSEADANALHVRLAGEAYCIGPAQAAQSYLRADKILEVAKACGADAVHPGYGFLSENSGFASACGEAGILFVGPRPEHLADFGLKHVARDLARRAGVPLLPGSDLVASAEEAMVQAERIGYPVMLKSTAGGGGIGLQLCSNGGELLEKYAMVKRLGEANFKESGVYVEKFVAVARHIEVQIFGLGDGRVEVFGERDCSAQRRNQKVVEETPAPGLLSETRAALHEAARSLATSVNYASAGTVEFLYDAGEQQFYFLEVNTRLQVEHGVTEEVFGVDLVEWMIRQADGSLPEEWLGQARQPQGHAIEARIYAEDPSKDFQPSAGLLIEVAFPEGARIDGWVETGTDIPSCYDPLLAKVICKGTDREEAVRHLQQALAKTRLYGIETNREYVLQILENADFATGAMSTALLQTLQSVSTSIDVLDGGTQTTVQDWPGRAGYWAVGVPPSGPMDSLAFRLANQAVGNAGDAPALEITLSGPSLRFRSETIICLCGHGVGASLLSVAAINVVRSGALPNADFHDPAQVLDGLNHTFEMERHNNMYFTMWYGVFNSSTRELRYASGGHPPALLIHSSTPPQELRTQGMIIGAMPDIPFTSAAVTVPENARLFVFSDGAYEIKRKDDEMLSFEEFTEVVAKEGLYENAIDRIYDFIKGLHGEGALDDDFSMLTIDFPPTP